MAAAATMTPDTLPRRSFVYRTLQRLGAEFAEVNGAAVAIGFGGSVESEAEQAAALGLADLSPLPRTGFKGAGTVEWLTRLGITIGPDSNQAYRQHDGALAARLSPTEIFFLDSLAGRGDGVRYLDGAWQWNGDTPPIPKGYPTPRQDSHCWFVVSGGQAPAMFAKICGIDLRPSRFADGQIAQTSVAKMSAIIIRDDFGRAVGNGAAEAAGVFHLLADSASAEYLWDCVMDAMQEFDGALVGLAALRRLARLG